MAKRVEIVEPPADEEPKEAEAPVERIINFEGCRNRASLKYTVDPGFQLTSDCFCVRFSPDSHHLATAFANGTINVYDAETGEHEKILLQAEAKVDARLPTTQLRWRPSGKASSILVSVCPDDNGRIQQWDVKSGKCLDTIVESGNQPFCIDYYCDGTLFATAGKDRMVRIYDEATKQIVKVLEGGDLKDTAGHSNRIMSVKYHPSNPQVIASGGLDNTIQIWDTRMGHSVRSLWDVYLNGDAIDFSQDGGQILTGSWRQTRSLQLWDFGKGEVVEELEWKSPHAGQTCMLFSCQFSRDPLSTMIFAGGSNANEAKLFQRSDSGPSVPFSVLTGLPKPAFSTDLAPNGRLAAVGGGDGVLRVLDIH